MFGSFRSHCLVPVYSVTSSKRVVFLSTTLIKVSKPAVLSTANFPTRRVAFGIFKIPRCGCIGIVNIRGGFFEGTSPTDLERVTFLTKWVTFCKKFFFNIGVTIKPHSRSLPPRPHSKSLPLVPLLRRVVRAKQHSLGLRS
jgi:hypothetical protein